jgi:hypothetical protein
MAAERKDTGEIGLLADRDAIHKVLAPAMDGVGDGGGVFAVLRHVEEHHGVRLEAEVILVGDFFSLAVVKREHGLEPAGHGIGDEGDQLPRESGDDEPLAFAGGKTVAVHLAGGDLAVERAGRHDVDQLLLDGPFAQRELFLAEDLKLGGEHGLARHLQGADRRGMRADSTRPDA